MSATLADVPNMHISEERSDLHQRLQALSCFVTNSGPGKSLSLDNETVSDEARLADDWFRILKAANEQGVYRGPLRTNQVSPTQVEQKQNVMVIGG